jgi:hypothetical protein
MKKLIWFWMLVIGLTVSVFAQEEPGNAPQKKHQFLDN